MIPKIVAKIGKLAQFLETTLVIISGIFVILVFIAQFDTTPPIRFLDKPGQHVTTAPDGRSFFVHRESCQDRVSAGTAIVRLIQVNGPVLIPLPSKAYNGLAGCNTFDILVLLPEEVPPGDYTYFVRYEFDINPFKKINVSAPPVLVTVTK